MHSLPRQNGAQFPRSWLCDFDECARGSVLVILDSHGANWRGIGGDIASLKFGFWRKVHTFGVRFTPWNDAGLENTARFFLPISIGNSKAAFRAKARAPLVRWLVFENFSAGLAGLFHAAIVKQGGLGTVTKTNDIERAG